MKLTTTIFATGILILTISVAHAVVTQHESAAPAKRDGISTNIDRPGIEKSPVGYKTDQLRCWQDGDLIVAENDWKLLDKSQAKVLHKANQKLYFYNFNETFCIYIED